MTVFLVDNFFDYVGFIELNSQRQILKPSLNHQPTNHPLTFYLRPKQKINPLQDQIQDWDRDHDQDQNQTNTRTKTGPSPRPRLRPNTKKIQKIRNK